MKNNINNLLISIGVCIITTLIVFYIRIPHDTITSSTNICKEDSLQQEINKLQSEIKSEEDGWDSKEKRYEDIIFEYEYGVEHIKQSHPDAYREFHRIIGYKERYNRETERENKLRLKTF